MTVKVVQALLLNNKDAASGKYPKITNLAIPAGKKIHIVVPVKFKALPGPRTAGTWFTTAAGSTATGVFQTARKVEGSTDKFTFVQVGTLKVNGASPAATTEHIYDKWYIIHIFGDTNALTSEMHLGSPVNNNGMMSSLWAYEDMQVFVDQPDSAADSYAGSLKTKYGIS